MWYNKGQNEMKIVLTVDLDKHGERIYYRKLFCKYLRIFPYQGLVNNLLLSAFVFKESVNARFVVAGSGIGQYVIHML